MAANLRTPTGPSVPYTLAPVPGLPDLESTSFASSFSLGPHSLVKSLVAGRPSLSHPSSIDPNASLLHASPVQSLAQRMVRKREFALQRSSLVGTSTPLKQNIELPAGENESVEEHEVGDSTEEGWTAVDRMRLWRHDAMTQHLYESSVYWGDKVLSWTHDPNDAFWLAQAHFLNHEYSRAETLLLKEFIAPSKTAASLKGKEREDVNGYLAEPIGGGKIQISGQQGSRLVDLSIGCRYLAAQCQVKLGKWADALELLGETNPFTQTGNSGPLVPNRDGGFKVEASMCHLRGLLLLRVNRADRAKQCFMEALALDVKCYDALEQLVAGEMMTVDEEWEFVQGLAYKEQTPEDAGFVRLMYMQRLKKYKHADEMADARKRLEQQYNLGGNSDVLFGLADTLYSQNRWADCFVITSQILNQVNIHTATLPLHLACMHHLPHMHSRLFLLAHELVEREPNSAISWYAVGVWYLTQKKYGEGRKYFSKASIMEPRFGPAWIGFGHTFALEGEHDQAVTAYSTASRLFQGSHLPLLFIGMQHLQVFNLTLANEHLAAAMKMCNSDPLVYNELGVLEYYNERYGDAALYLERALELADKTQSSQSIWIKTRFNLAQAYRRLGRLEEAKINFRKVLDLQPRNASAMTSLGMVQHLSGEVDDAIMSYHEALSVRPADNDTITLLNLALEDAADAGSLGFRGIAHSEDVWRANVLREQKQQEQIRKLAKVRGDTTKETSSISLASVSAIAGVSGMSLDDMDIA
ncbi:TPR-like protein [Calocera viscosa TUFC12733]|uniref:TPR-like protein n=1 Tax=Calocera viscosa (strain TUFC12733) TaxID=1330018 RepID=A0A167R4Q5_CALVF|nr:TPR-like protein [Calocera viscosa TUFC12733]